MLKDHGCGDLRATDAGTRVTLAGWVNRRRDHGGLIFLDLRDRSGIVQCVVDPSDSPAAHAVAERVRSEWCLQLAGTVVRRSAETVNPGMATGEIEIRIDSARVFSESKTPPFYVNEDSPVDEALRMQHRYLDLRRQRMTRNLLARHRMVKRIRDLMDGEGFIEVETPILMKSTPEGARDFLVPSRIRPGEFYALPQSPQQLKQLLMIAGVEKYFQIARCFRDEDQRADRQLEFTQLDLEMSFVERDDVLGLVERVVLDVFRTSRPDMLVPDRIPRMSYDEVMEAYGSDKPDLRFGLPLHDVADLVADAGFVVFDSVRESGGRIKAVRIPGGAALSRRQADELIAFVREKGAKGLVTIARDADGFRSPAAKFLGEDRMAAICDRCDVAVGDMVGIVADAPAVANRALAELRQLAAERAGLIDPKHVALLWVLDFPAFEWLEDEGRWDAVHNPFAGIHTEDLPRLEDDPASVRSYQYDIVCNGFELGGGSIRIADPALQARVFELMGNDPADVREKFGGFLTAFDYGPPPHGGIALGIDRWVACLCDEPNIREVIAFPKTASAADLMLGAPSAVAQKQLDELHIALLPPEGVAMLDRLPRFVAEARLPDFPAAVVEDGIRQLRDAFAAMASGQDAAPVQRLTDLESSLEGGASIVGAASSASSEGAALVNATAGVWHDLDSGQRFSGSHPAIHVIPAVLAVAEARGATGHDVLAAVILGCEAGARIGVAAGPLRRGMSPHGGWAVIGAAAGVARLLGWDADGVARAMRIASSLTLMSSTSVHHNGANVRHLQAGDGARNGVLACRLAEAGVTGEPEGIQNVVGGFVGPPFVERRAVVDLGEDWEFLRGYYKLHACSRWGHAAIDGLLAIRARSGSQAIERIEVETYAAAAGMGAVRPKTSLAAKFSLPFTLASAWTRGNAGRDAFDGEALGSEAIAALADHVSLHEDPQFSALAPGYRAARVRVRFAGGSSDTETRMNALGEPEDETRDTWLRQKFGELTTALPASEELWTAIGAIDRVEDIRAVTGLASPAPRMR